MQQNSKNIMRAELIKMVALLRGTLYSIVNDTEPPDEQEVRRVLEETAFDIDGDSFDDPEPECSLYSTDKEWFEWFVQATNSNSDSDSDSGSGSVEFSDVLKCRFIRETGKLPSKGWHYWSTGEEMTEQDLKGIKEIIDE